MKKIVITSVACLVLWANVASAQPQVSGPFLPSGCTADQTIAYNATTAAWECDSTISVTSLTASGTAPVVTWTDTTAGEDDFSFTVDADVGTLASGATNIWQAFGATHASAGDIYFINDVALDSDAGLLYFGASQDNAIGRADASSLYVSKGLRVGSNGAVADNNLVVDGTLVVSEVGPHAIGGAIAADQGVTIKGSFTAPTAAPVGVRFQQTIAAGAASGSMYGFYNSPTIVEYSSGVHALLVGAGFGAPTITGGVATVTNAATVYIAGAPSATVTGANYALWVDAGTVRLDGDLGVSTATVPNVYASAYHVGATAGIDATCVAAVATITVSKGIVTAITCP